MDKLVIEGGVALRGDVRVGTAKNSVLPILAATLLTTEPCRILDAPDLRDVNTMLRILPALGVQCERDADGSIATLGYRKRGTHGVSRRPSTLH